MLRHHWKSIQHLDRFRHRESIDDQTDEIPKRDRARKFMIRQHNRLLQDQIHPNRICHRCHSPIPHYHRLNWNEMISSQKQSSSTTPAVQTCTSAFEIAGPSSALNVLAGTTKHNYSKEFVPIVVEHNHSSFGALLFLLTVIFILLIFLIGYDRMTINCSKFCDPLPDTSLANRHRSVSQRSMSRQSSPASH